MSKHNDACVNYKKWFLDEHGYGFCEVCSRSDLPLDTHHIYYASKYPDHPELHNFLNLLLVCRTCHASFHAGKYKKQFEEIEAKRGLKQLFL